MIVVKLGGSLLQSDALLACLNGVEKKYQDRTVVIVPGGGVFADQVRQSQHRWQFDDIAAHRMAILAMQQMALLFKALKTNFILVSSVQEILAEFRHNKILIWSPDICELDQAGIPASWNITSDSLAAWLARALSAEELVVVKSVVINGGLNARELAEQQIVDGAFFDFVSQAPFLWQVVDKDGFCQ
ncbi:MAG: uridylate kinase [Methylococcaceae bacterium]|nr:uridylate kinase [Methylococcaceae bacterium]